MMNRSFLTYCFAFIAIVVLNSCDSEPPLPKPVGYFRIDLPENEYQPKELGCPFSFEISKESRLLFFEDTRELCWFNIEYPDLGATIHITYKPVSDNLRELLEESRSMTYEHQVKASRIDSKRIDAPENQVYGLTYDLGGTVASPYQFFVTDSVDHFLRGALYFNAKPNPDSLQPSFNFVKRDLEHLIETFEWK